MPGKPQPPRKRSATKAEQLRWTVFYLGSKGERIGEVLAPDEHTALLRAAEECRVPPERRFKLMVMRREQ